MQLKKSPKASLEDKKLTYVLMGLVLVLSICYVAFEWTEKEEICVRHFVLGYFFLSPFESDVANAQYKYQTHKDIGQFLVFQACFR